MKISAVAQLADVSKQTVEYYIMLGLIRPYRGRGWGTRLLGTMVDWAREQPSIAWIDLGVIGDNEGAARLYRDFGFTAVAEVPDRWRVDGLHLRERMMALYVGED